MGWSVGIDGMKRRVDPSKERVWEPAPKTEIERAQASTRRAYMTCLDQFIASAIVSDGRLPGVHPQMPFLFGAGET